MIKWVYRETEGEVGCGFYKNERLTGKQWYSLEHEQYFCKTCKDAIDYSESLKAIAGSFITRRR